MKITSAVNQEDCFEGGSSVRYWFDEAWTCAQVKRLAALGRLDHFPSFPRPFFRLIGRSGIQVKGVEGDASCLAVFPKEGRRAAQEEFEQQFRQSIGEQNWQ